MLRFNDDNIYLVSNILLPFFKVPYFDVSLKAVVFGVSVVGSIYCLSTIFIQIYEGGKGKNGSTVAVCHLYLCLFTAYQLITYKSYEDFLMLNRSLFLHC